MSKRPASWANADDEPQGDDDGGPLFGGYRNGNNPRPFDVGMAASAASGSRWSIEDFAVLDAAIRKLAASGERFTSDDVWRLSPTVKFTKGIGAKLTAAARSGLIHNTGERRVSARGGDHDHAQSLSVWKGGSKPK